MPEVLVRKKKPRRKSYRECAGAWVYEHRPQLAVTGAFVIAVAVGAVCVKMGMPA